MLETFKIKFRDLQNIKKLPPRDQGHYLPFNSFPHGCPLGGFGAGTFSRSPYGDFNIWHIKVGAHIEEELKSCTFHAYQRVCDSDEVHLNILTTRDYKDKKLNKFGKPYSTRHGSYSASFPKSKYVFDSRETPAEITCEQFSPILPNNYEETSYPVAVFAHKVRNKTNKKIEVSLMLSWANMTGWKFEDQRPGIQDNWFSFIKTNGDKTHLLKRSKDQKMLGLVMGQNKKKATQELDGEICIALSGNKEDHLSYQEYFYLHGTGEELYKQFSEDGTLKNILPPNMLEHQNYGSAIAIKVTLEPKEVREIPFVLAWDLPIVHFGEKSNRYKYYTRFFSETGKNSWAMAEKALKDYPSWSRQIDEWHQEIVKKSKINDHILSPRSRQNYYRALINELYFLSDGGSFWDAETGDFGLLECFDYPFYETLDVRFYGSFPLLKFWPEIELRIMERFSETITLEDKAKVRFNFYTDDLEKPLPLNPNERRLYYDHKKIYGSCPHDLGSPKDQPFDHPAAYTWQNTNYWKDLNPKFILLVYRDFVYTGNTKFLKKCWPAIKLAADYVLKMDTDGDGLPEHHGYPDQTYDNWIMHGVSAYCGTLWLATLSAMIAMAGLLKDTKVQKKYKNLLPKAQNSFEKKLWNKKHYNFCSGSTDVMADQLIGQWYIDLLGLENIVPEDHIKKTLKTIYNLNYRRTSGGKWGAVSGKKLNNRPVDAEQGRDVWVGANFALCSLFLHHQQPKQAEAILNTMSRIIYDNGFFFRTPEGWDTKGQFTATMYMRPNAIWSLEL